MARLISIPTPVQSLFYRNVENLSFREIKESLKQSGKDISLSTIHSYIKTHNDDLFEIKIVKRKPIDSPPHEKTKRHLSDDEKTALECWQ